MDTRTGMIYTPEEIEALDKVFRDRMDKGDFLSQYMKPVPQKEDLKEMVVPPTDKQLRTQKVGRNDLCPCGSLKKFKKCCLRLKEDTMANIRRELEKMDNDQT